MRFGEQVHAKADYLVYEGASGRRLCRGAEGADARRADERMTYAEAHDKVAEISNLFKHEYGCVKGDRIAIASRNLNEWILCFWVRPLPKQLFLRSN